MGIHAENVPYAPWQPILLPLPSLWQHWFDFCPCTVAFSRIACTLNHTVGNLFSLLPLLGTVLLRFTHVLQLSAGHSLLLSSSPSCGCNHSVPVPRLRDFWVISSFWQPCKAVTTFVRVFMGTCVFISPGWLSSSGIAWLYDNSVFNFIKNSICFLIRGSVLFSLPWLALHGDFIYPCYPFTLASWHGIKPSLSIVFNSGYSSEPHL